MDVIFKCNGLSGLKEKPTNEGTST